MLATGCPIKGGTPLADILEMEKYGGYLLSFNGARITKCSTGDIIYNRTLPESVIRPIFETVKNYPGVDIISYTDREILSGICSNQYTEKEKFINKMDIIPVANFPDALTFPVNKLLLPGPPEI